MKKTNKMMTGVLSALVASTLAGCNSNSTIPDDYYIEESSFEPDSAYEPSTINEQQEEVPLEEDDNLESPSIENPFPINTETQIEDNGGFEVDNNGTGQTESEFYTEESITDPPADSDCSYWEWDEETGAYYCGDIGSAYANHYFYGGQYYANQHALISSTSYQSSKSSSGSYMSGIGSGSPGGFGG